MKTIVAKFEPGDIVATPAFAAKCNPAYAMACLERHLMGSWGLVDEDDGNANDRALKEGGRLLSVYPLPDDPADFWIITEADRSATTFLLPSDY